MKGLVFAILSLFVFSAGCGKADGKKQEEPPPTPTCSQMDVTGAYFLIMIKVEDNCTAEDANEFYGFLTEFSEVLYDAETCMSIMSFESDVFSFYGLLTPPVPPEEAAEFISEGEALTPEIKNYLYIGEFASIDGDAKQAEFHGGILVADINPNLCTETKAQKTYLLIGTRPSESE